jgi:hypothetical protein
MPKGTSYENEPMPKGTSYENKPMPKGTSSEKEPMKIMEYIHFMHFM